MLDLVTQSYYLI